MSSNSQRSKALNKAYRALNKIDKSAIIKRDSLHSRYAVNKYSITIKFSNSNNYSTFKEKYIEQLGADLQLSEVAKTSKSLREFKSNGKNVDIVMSDLGQLNTDSLLLSVSIY